MFKPNNTKTNWWKFTAIASWIVTVILVTGVIALNIYCIDYIFDVEGLIDKRKAKKMQHPDIYKPVATQMAKYCQGTSEAMDIMYYLDIFPDCIDDLRFNRGEFSPKWGYLEKRGLINATYVLKLDDTYIDELKSRWNLYFESDLEDRRLLYTFEINKNESIRGREKLPSDESPWQ